MESEVIVDDVEVKNGLSVLTLKSLKENIKIILELPTRIIREAELNISRGASLLLKIASSEFNEAPWKIYAEGVYYMKKTGNGNHTYYISIGGLQLKLLSDTPLDDFEKVKVMTKLYIALK
ncbi:MAG: hypothetical protein DRJ52_00055 [Thermoprotei archaeon]|nr:MAG: hypothetical protein DRJ52_00055 [Thermoprotei archaeon]RLE98880.1 MAG: hypothetical protein DRJ63_06940 [Thermoprotei archaeon]